LTQQRVFLVQCLCPQRHAIVANPYEADADLDEAGKRELMQRTEDQVATLIAVGIIDPWCGLCKATQESWTCSIGRTSYSIIEDAMPALREFEEQNLRTARRLRASKN